MDKTKVEDMIIEMIEPKLKEIETKFVDGKGLTQEDINTLLLKSQYNHINHLDGKLNEVTADVASLKGDFNLLNVDLTGRMDSLEQRLTGRMDSFEERITGRIGSFESRIELKISEAINKNMRWSIGLIAFIVTLLKLADMFLVK